MWIWYPGDFELYYALKQNFSRVERGFGWPAFWKSEGYRNRVVFTRMYHLQEATTFRVLAQGVGYVLVGDQKYPFGATVTCPAGTTRIRIHVGCIETFPSIFIEGDVVHSDGDWLVEDYDKPPVKVGYSRYFTQATQNPSNWEYAEKIYLPCKVTSLDNGTLFEFETELTAMLKIDYKQSYRPLTIYCGESKEEATDLLHCYYSWQPNEQTHQTPRCALRFAYIPDCTPEEIQVTAIHQYVDIPEKAHFTCDDEELNQIWEVASHTFRLCSDVFFLDGIKRDKWIWCGDAFQSFAVNQYLLADPDINRRTLLALRGNDPITTHINTILDYTMYWILGVKAHYDAYGDLDFVKQVYPKLLTTMDFLESQCDEHGFLVGRPNDWIYIDWAEMDKTGAVCAIQMLFVACYQAMFLMSHLVGRTDSTYQQKERTLRNNIQKFYWDNEKQAFIDSFASGRRNVTRHANIFAILFGIATQSQAEQLVHSVLLNDAIPKITTPYFEYYELDALCQMGQLDKVMEQIHAYWGGMLKRGAVTFWEEYDPTVPQEEQYDMYGDRFGKSLCHAWAASPIYLIAKYFIGLHIEQGGQTFHVEPNLKYFKSFDCTLPVGTEMLVHILYDGEQVTVERERSR